jgi:hypothetical protein
MPNVLFFSPFQPPGGYQDGRRLTYFQMRDQMANLIHE